MMNFVAAQKPLLLGLMKMVGVITHAVEIESGTVMNIWVPSETIKKPKKSATMAHQQTNQTRCGAPCSSTVLLPRGSSRGNSKWTPSPRNTLSRCRTFSSSADFRGGVSSEWVRKLGIERCTLVGFSYDGIVAFTLAELYPELVETVDDEEERSFVLHSLRREDTLGVLFLGCLGESSQARKRELKKVILPLRILSGGEPRQSLGLRYPPGGP